MEKKSFLETWWVAVRPFAFPASVVPVLFGTVLAVTVGGASFDVPLFLLSLGAMVLLHAGANVLSDYNDFRKGLDTEPLPGSGAIVRGLLAPRTALLGSFVLLAAGIVLGLTVALSVGRAILFIGLVGIALGILYSSGPFPLKYNALGDFVVFCNFGILGSLGAWTAQTRFVSWVPVLWAIPGSLLVAAILHANNWRDIETDTAKGIRTVAAILGRRLSAFYYATLLFGPFLFVLLFALLSNAMGIDPAMPYTFLITLAALPQALKIFKKGLEAQKRGTHEELAALDKETAQLNLLFGVLATVALLV